MQHAPGSSLAGSGVTGVYATLIDTDAVSYNSAHVYFSSVAIGQVGTEVELTSKTFTNGIFDSLNATFPNVSGNTAEAIILFIKTADANTTWRLFAWLDSGITGLPAVPNGSDISAAWSATGILAL